ncbi:USP25 [Lepeophtheirus salmonis]|uniref:ubiquitinyl hydrolase 1 n=1 Tax=Lepeophtheirus salmonis TaxID=72036 RepID=A0A7R8D5G6_LEPSM|nr:USP25 [Lepeophtheirus salmonis]CAF3035678.1 USP25 [Lepeophtheirus salmonis]
MTVCEETAPTTPGSRPGVNLSFEAYSSKYPEAAEKMCQQLTEITEVEDRAELNRAFNSTFTQTQCVHNHRVPSPQGSPRQRSKDNPYAAESNKQPSLEASMEIVDSSKEFIRRLFKHTDEDLQKAIKLSLEEAHKSQVSSGVSQEDQDVSKALEASFMEGGSNRRKRKDKWEDPLNPHDRTRNGIWPVGLKNVGQTCWFSAVIQSLFYLPAFRTLVLNFSIPSSITKNSLKSDKKTKKVLEFMEELRKLFSLLVASRRKYVDPVRSVEILKGSIGSASIDNNQQDVSEFTHKVLEWAELAFNMDCKLESSSSSSSAPPLSSSSNNPMANLFYGQVMTEGKNRAYPFHIQILLDSGIFL